MSESHSIQCDEGNGDTTLTSWHPAFRPDEVSASAQDSHATTFSSPQEQYDHSVPSKDITDSLLSVHGTPELPETVVTQPNSQDDALVPLAEQQPAAVWDSSEEGGGFFDNLSGENTTQAAVSSDAQVAPIAEPGEAGVFRRDESKQTASSEDFGAHFITQEPSQAPQDPEADAVDPAWGLSRTNSDAFEVLGHIDRTSSFPQFALQPSHPLAPTQAEAILEAENERDEREEDLEHLAPDRQDDNGGQLDELLWTQHQEGRGSKDEDASFFDNFNEHQDSINEPSDAEARFEEGVPLVAEHNEEEEANGITGAGPSAMDALFHSDPEPSDVSFFNQPHQQEVSEQDLRHNLERKDTVDVLSSMRFDAHGSSNERETNQQDPISVKILNRDPNPPAQQEDIDAMWKAALEDDEFLPDDDDGFLSDGSDGPFPGDQNDQSLQNAPQSQPVQRPGVVSQRAPSSYTPHQPSTSEMAQGFSGSPWTGSAEPSPLGSSFNHQPQRPELMPKTESFVDQKGGYKSPYDLPEDLTTRHKRRVQMQPSVQSLRSSGAPPPPRSSSMASDAGFVQPLRQSSQSSPNIADFSRPGTSSSVGPPSTGALNGTRPPIQAASSSSSFFEELPVASRPRPTTSSGRYTPMQTSGLQAPPPMAGIRSVSSASGPLQPPIDVQTPKNASLSEPPKGNTYAQFELQKPERVIGQALPSVKPTAGETKVSSAKEILNVDTQAARFPGPLRSKSKKKEVLTWLSERISLLEQVNIAHSLEPQLPDPLTCRTEKVLLWKVLRIFVEHDGVVEGKVDAQKAIAALLVPESNFPETNGIHPDEGSHTNGIHSFHGYQLPSDPVDPSAVEQIRIFLLHGEREKAVWDAVDHRLWAHAMLIASTLDRTVWKQVVQEFVRQEVKTVGENTESLAALYQCFAGNLEDSIDQLVPPSARAGLQMVSKVASNGPTKNALDGLNKWRETLCLAVNNRCPDDHVAIAALGRLLMTYSRIEASHICFLLSHAMPAATFGGADEPQANIVLLGVDQRQPGFYNDEDAIILTEIYEFATSVLASHVSTSALLPHLQGYKFQRAVMLAETGFKTEALQYCEAISGAVKAVTKVSPYFHPLFIAELDEFYNRLRQAPVEASSSWKPSMEKVSGSLLSKFNTFVTGGDDETASTGSAKDAQEFGPFAKVAGTPNISREPSSVDLYSSFTNGGSQPMPVAAGGGRYNPNNQYAPRSSSEQVRGRSSLDVARSPSYSSTRPQKSPSLDQSSFAQATTAAPSLASPYQGLMQSPPQYQPSPPSSSYVPLSGATESPYTPQQRSYAPTPPISDPSYQHIPSQQSYAPNAPTNNLDHTIAQTPMNTEQVPAFGGYQPHIQQSPLVPSQPSPPPTEEHKEQPRESYQSYGGYEPPSYGTGYVPYEPEPDDEPDKKSDAPKKSNSFMDLDDNDPMSTASTMTAVKPVNKDLDRARKDAEADAAFRHAAEEDAKRSAQKTLNKKGSWFGTWFAKGEENKSEAGQKVYKAKLGEESAFYYDKELKKWVNKKDPNSATAVAKAAPPPPRTGPPSRMPSGMGPPPPPGPSSGPPKSVGLPPSTSMPSIPNPPSRAESPGTNGSTPSLAAPPPFQRAATGPSPAAGPPRPKLSSKPSDIDDLLGGPLVSRTGGTASRGAKKKRTGYVDIMAQQK
ncbi:putative copii coat assembly protein sec16 [Phaeomoniella chlamydospora]|uniref:Protein transport protein sec16 n=1 Tax=Phaeomoniella chlamydospora TaxID=158046 RepID=A0A0G2EKX0_PHACM|nr:putative copii coat assembly protein sec16 [Phaeomoniella chlamydospora]